MGGFWSLLIDIRIWLYGLPFLLIIGFFNIFLFYWGAFGLLGDRLGFFLFFGGFCLPGFIGAMGLGVLGFCGRKLYIKNTNKKIITVLERNLGMGFDSLGRVMIK